MKRTLFILGRTPQLAFLELQVFYPDAAMIAPSVALVPHEVDTAAAIRDLGGTVKVAEVLGEAKAIDVHDVFEYLLPFVSDGKIVFGLSGYGNSTIPPSYLTIIKKLFHERTINARFVESKHQEALGSVVISKQHVVECIIVGLESTNLIAVTREVQNFEDWNTRDSARPAVDPHRGMLPPKVARMIVNVALGGDLSTTKTLLDPFCGVGTVVAEALMRKSHAIGMDISAPTMVKAQKNIDWLRAQYGLLQNDPPRMLVADATHVSELVPKNSIDAIATEPFMGEQRASNSVENILKGLEKLYIGCLRDWSTVLKPGGRIVMAIPAYVTPRGIRTVKKVVDRCEILGYTLCAGPIEYSRPQATVRREFYIFQKK